jgi:pimeloyl-ACP methyl ester carboxylesterase
LKIIIAATILSLCAISFLVYGSSAVNFTVYAQSYLQTIKHRNLVIDLGNGVKTNAQLTYPAVGKGPYPGVLLIPGTGLVDMNETLGHIRIDNQTGQKIYPPTQPFWQISEYLSERGFAVLRYDKRGVGTNFTTLDSNLWGNATINDLIHDADRALDVLIQQPEVDDNKITLIGHSEGTTIAPRVAIDNPGKVDNIVLIMEQPNNYVRNTTQITTLS